LLSLVKSFNYSLVVFMALNKPLRERSSGIPGDATAVELRKVLAKLVESGAVSADHVKGALGQIRTGTANMVKTASAVSKGPEIIISSPEKMLLAQLVGDYERQAGYLRATGQANEGMFSRLQIINALTPKVLAQALRISKLGKGAMVKGLLVPDNDHHAKVKIIDDRVKATNDYLGVKSDTRCTVFHDPDNITLWNGGKKWPAKKQWQYMIFQGGRDVARDSNIRGTKFQVAKAWVAEIKKTGLNVLTGADPYLAAMSQSFNEGGTLDWQNFTVLNADILAKTSPVSGGRYLYGQVRLGTGFPDGAGDDLVVRAAMGVDVPKA
jgi:hypothetical protein